MNINKLNADEKFCAGMTMCRIIEPIEEVLKDKKNDKSVKKVLKYIKFKFEEIQSEISGALSEDMINALEKIIGRKIDE